MFRFAKSEENVDLELIGLEKIVRVILYGPVLAKI